MFQYVHVVSRESFPYQDHQIYRKGQYKTLLMKQREQTQCKDLQKNKVLLGHCNAVEVYLTTVIKSFSLLLTKFPLWRGRFRHYPDIF